MKKISKFFINRPVVAIVISILITLLGFLSYEHLQLSWLPQVTVPILSVETAYPNASAKTIESDITTPIENSLLGLNNLNSMSSSSSDGLSSLTLEFKPGSNLNYSEADVRSNIQNILNNLPSDVKMPVISKMDPNQQPIFIVSFSSKTISLPELTDYITNYVIPQFNSLDGVGKITTWGERNTAMRIWLDTEKMAARNITVSDVLQKLRNENISIPTGKIKNQDRYYTITANFKMQEAPQFANIIINNDHSNIVRLGDIATIEIGAENSDKLFRVNQTTGIAIGLIPRTDANPLTVAEQAIALFNTMKMKLPPTLKTHIVYNQANFVNASMKSVYHSLIEAIILVLVVVMLFLGSLRSAIIPIMTIPLCLISIFTLLYLMGYSINTMTMLAMVLSIGLVVDDAIVMLENITRYIEKGIKPFEAAVKGSYQISYAIIAITIVTAIVYLPLSFINSTIGLFFREFGFTLAGTVLISGLIALTLSPMMCAYLLKPNTQQSTAQKLIEFYTQKLIRFYRVCLLKAIKARKYVFVGIVASLIAGYFLLTHLNSELAPHQDQDSVNVRALAPSDASFNYTASFVPELEELYKGIPGIQSYLVQMWEPDLIYIFTVLNNRADRKLTDLEISNILNQRANKITGLDVNVFPTPPPLTWFSYDNNDGKIRMVLMTNGSYEYLHNQAQNLMKEIKQYAGTAAVDDGLKWNSEQINLAINREALADQGIATETISDTLRTMLGGIDLGYFQRNENNYKIIAQISPNQLKDINILNRIFVHSANSLIPINTFIDTKIQPSPISYSHYSNLRSDTIVIDQKAGYDMGKMVSYLQNITKKLPADIRYDFTGSAKLFLSSNKEMSVIFILALLFVYLILVIQFNNFSDPLIVLLSTPLALVGALLTLWLTGCSLNVYSEIGMITLVSLITKHGILIVEFTNKLREQHTSLYSALIKATTLRLRPILMTTIAMLLGAVPLAFAHGPGAEDRQQIGWVIIGGLFVGTLLTLFVIPVAYYSLKCKKPRLVSIIFKNTQKSGSIPSESI